MQYQVVRILVRHEFLQYEKNEKLNNEHKEQKKHSTYNLKIQEGSVSHRRLLE